MDLEYQEILLIKLVKQNGLHLDDTRITAEERIKLWSEIALRCMYYSVEVCQEKWKQLQTEYALDKSLPKFRHGVLNFLDEVNIAEKVGEPEKVQKEPDENLQVKPSTSKDPTIIICSSDKIRNEKNVSSKEEKTPSTMGCNITEMTFSENNRNTYTKVQKNKESLNQKSGLSLGNILHDNPEKSIHQSTIETEVRKLMDHFIGTDNINAMNKNQEYTVTEKEKEGEEILLKLKEMDNKSFYSFLADLVCPFPEDKQKMLRLKIGVLIADLEIFLLRYKMPE